MNIRTNDNCPKQYQNPQNDNASPRPQPQQHRRPRGFAATAAAAASSAMSPTATTTTTTTTTASGGKGRKEREKEKERTKLRERHRRAITSRMLAGLRQYGNFPLPARADMNDVLAALAREAGWTVDPDGTTYRQLPPPAQMATYPLRSLGSPVSASSLKTCAAKPSSECHPSALGVDESLSHSSFYSVEFPGREPKNPKYTGYSPLNSAECFEADQLMGDVQNGEHGNDFMGTPYVPVYVMLPTSAINTFCQLVDPEGIRQEISHIKALNADGVAVSCWWGIVEGWNPQKYEWSGYRELFNIIREFKMKLQVIMAFHEFGGNDSGDVPIMLPQWVLEIGKDNQDIFFTDREGRRNTECLSWGIDKERVLRGRTGIEVYFDLMRSFRTEFDDFFAEGLISAVEIGLGASGELKYPSHSERMGWRYPGIGEFQCYDKYLQQNLRKAAKLRGHTFLGKGPESSGHYNSRPHETGFFCERGDYDSYYGRIFLHWYAQLLIDHADHVLSLASLAFDETQIIVKIPAVYWWYRTSSHAAELTAGYYNPMNQNGYVPVFEVLKKHSVTVKFVCSSLKLSCLESDDGLSDPEGLNWQVLNSAWDRELNMAGENAVPCYNREGYMRVVEIAKPKDDPDHRHFSLFVYQHPSLFAQNPISLADLDYFIKCMHGELSCDLEP